MSGTNRVIEQTNAYISLINLLTTKYIVIFGKLINEDEDNIKVDDLERSVSSLQFKMDKMKQQFGLVDDTEKATPINFFTEHVNDVKQVFTLKEFINNKIAIVKEKAKNNESFEIKDLSIKDVFTLSIDIDELLERYGKKTRVYTSGRILAVPPAWVLLHDLWTYDPDYEIIRYADRIEVKYMRESEIKLKK